MAARVAVVLAGCGRADGSEIHESVSVLVHLSRAGASYRCFAPDAPQAEVVNHATGQPSPRESRNQMIEAARISRGEIAPLSALQAGEFDALVFPGGFGAAKNLCDFASKGADCRANPDVERAIKAFHAAGKPIALCCIAPVLAARVLGTAAGGPGCAVTIGTDEATAAAIATMGARNVGKSVLEAHTDAANRIVTTPAYMCDAKPHEVFDGIGEMIAGLMKMAGK